MLGGELIIGFVIVNIARDSLRVYVKAFRLGQRVDAVLHFSEQRISTGSHVGQSARPDSGGQNSIIIIDPPRSQQLAPIVPIRENLRDRVRVVRRRDHHEISAALLLLASRYSRRNRIAVDLLSWRL